MPPSDFRLAREQQQHEETEKGPIIHNLYNVDEYPYIPSLKIDINDVRTVCKVTVAIMLFNIYNNNGRDVTSIIESDALKGISEGLNVKVVSGGITNSLFCVSGLKSSDFDDLMKDEVAERNADAMDDAVLVRVFGAEGMIDRDIETSTYASLSSTKIAPGYYGRFQNGRIETWLPHHQPLTLADLPSSARAIAIEMAKLHTSYKVPDYLFDYHDPNKPAMWTQLHDWMDQALKVQKWKSVRDEDMVKELNLISVKKELEWLEQTVIPTDASVAFCHNDLLAANIMKLSSTTSTTHKQKEQSMIQLIDFEYGGVNYTSFDIANHFNEYAGGTDKPDGIPDYSLIPDHNTKVNFVTCYVHTSRSISQKTQEEEEDEEVKRLLKEVNAFMLANHLYWGLWGVNQAAMEGCEEFDYMVYAKNRIGEYYLCCKEWKKE